MRNMRDVPILCGENLWAARSRPGRIPLPRCADRDLLPRLGLTRPGVPGLPVSLGVLSR